MQQEDQTLSQENIDAVLKYLDMSPRDALKVEAAKIMRALRKSEEDIRNEALEEAINECNIVYQHRKDMGFVREASAARTCLDLVKALKTAEPSQGEGS